MHVTIVAHIWVRKTVGSRFMTVGVYIFVDYLFTLAQELRHIFEEIAVIGLGCLHNVIKRLIRDGADPTGCPYV